MKSAISKAAHQNTIKTKNKKIHVKVFSDSCLS